MKQNIRIGMTCQTMRMRNSHPANNQRPTGDQRMHVSPLPYTERELRKRRSGIAHDIQRSIKSKSSGQVTLKLRGEPCTSKGA